jgi:hypothetical protein
LGWDQRNQFDLFRDLPGGTPQLQKLSQEMRKQGEPGSHLLQSMG